jgi:hypothetical protein
MLPNHKRPQLAAWSAAWIRASGPTILSERLDMATDSAEHCCIWLSLPSTSSTRALNAAFGTRD